MPSNQFKTISAFYDSFHNSTLTANHVDDGVEIDIDGNFIVLSPEHAMFLVRDILKGLVERITTDQDDIPDHELDAIIAEEETSVPCECIYCVIAAEDEGE